MWKTANGNIFILILTNCIMEIDIYYLYIYIGSVSLCTKSKWNYPLKTMKIMFSIINFLPIEVKYIPK